MQKYVDKLKLYAIIKSTTKTNHRQTSRKKSNLSKGGTDHLTSKVLPQKLTSSIK